MSLILMNLDRLDAISEFIKSSELALKYSVFLRLKYSRYFSFYMGNIADEFY